MTKQKFLVGIFVSFSLSIAHTQDLAVEHFDSLSGPLHQYQGNNSGWLGNWYNQDEYVGGDGYRITDTNPMTHPVIAGLGNYCVGGGDNRSTGRFFDAFGTFADHADVNGRIGEGTIYFSFLIRKLEDNDTPIEIVLADDSGTPWVINQELIKMGYFGTASNILSDRYWSLATFNENQIVLTDSTITIGQTYQIMVEIDFGPLASNTTTVNMWVNPNNGIPDLLTPDASITSMNDLGFWNIVLFFEATGTGHGSFDEFRFSDELSVVLPVEYVEFNGTENNSEILLSWATATERQNQYFLLQRSKNAKNWLTIGQIPGNGDSSHLINYQYTDSTPFSGLNYYRLIQVDFDGSENISEIISVNYSEHTTLNVEVRLGERSIQINSATAINEISIVDITGKIIHHDFLDSNKVEYLLMEGEKNVYVLKIQTEKGFWKQKILSSPISF